MCMEGSSFFQTPLGVAAIQVIKDKWENTILPTFLIRFIICGFVWVFFQLAFILKGHNRHYFLVCSCWRWPGRAGINNKRFT